MQADLNNNILVKGEELEIIYEGPSFDGRMEVPHLISQLKSTENIIREVILELYKEKKLENPEEIKLYLKIKRGSFQEIISIVFNHPLTSAIVGGCIVALFEKVLNKKEKTQVNEIKIENLTQNVNIVNEINQIILPLQNKKDRVIISSPSNDKIKMEIVYDDRKNLKDALRKLQDEVLIEVYEEEFFGYINMVNVDKDSFGFRLEGTNKHVPVSFKDTPKLEEIRKILAERVKIKAKATYRNKELSRLEITSYEIKNRKNLSDYLGNEKTN
jgi:hypothetical protein